jgi:DNA-binding CsgD family transcriptional regulator
MRGSELNHEERFKMIRRKLKQGMKEEIKTLIEKDYSMISGEKVREMFASDILRLIEQRQDYAMNIDSGQVMWLGVKREERQGYGKNASNTEIVPVTLTLLSPNDIDMLSSGFTAREVRETRMIRLFQEGYEQGGVLSSNDIALLLNVSPSTVSKQVREYMERTKEVVPTRGTVHDLGRAITHKRIIIRLYLEGYLTPEIARMTKHSEEACDRYIRAFNKVRMLADRKLNADEIARTLEMSSFLVREYLDIYEEFKGGEGNAK